MNRELDDFVAGRLDEIGRVLPRRVREGEGWRERLAPILLASDFAFEVLGREPEWLHGLSREAPWTLRRLPPDAGPGAYARARQHAALRWIWRDLHASDALEEILTATSRTAEALLRTAEAQARRELSTRYGQARDGQGRPLPLLLVGMGKLGGGELNFSSDVDLIAAFAESGETDGDQSLDHQAYFGRVLARVATLLGGPPTEFAYRIDLRLRPFGSSGPTTLSLAALEQYYQREGRDWERYAWIKGRCLTGNPADAASIDDLIRPFVYRRYLDYGAFAGLRDLKRRVDLEVRRRDLAENLKLGRGGIREVEFIVQLAQLIRGGRDPSLRVRGTLPALRRLVATGLMPQASGQRLEAAYRFLRQVENRIQMLGDQQTHELPAEPLARARIARALGYPGVDALLEALERHRRVVAEEFDATMPDARAEAGGVGVSGWPEGAPGGEETLARLPEAGREALARLRDGGAFRALSAIGRSRLERILPRLLGLAAQTGDVARVSSAVVSFAQAVSRRSSYLALLEERPAVCERLVRIFDQSPWLADRLIEAPILLDDLLDHARLARFDEDALRGELALGLAGVNIHDPEATLLRLREFALAVQLRAGLAFLAGTLPAVECTAALTRVADLVLEAVLVLAANDLHARHGGLSRRGRAGEGFAIIGYGSLGGRELGFGSDLDLVFLYRDALGSRSSRGAHPIEGQRLMTRLAQRVLALLTTRTAIGALYEVDTRLQPDGDRGGLLVTGVDAFGRYLRERAWTYEHQALVRARPVTGDAEVMHAFQRLRRQLLARARDPAGLARDVHEMRDRMRRHLDRSDPEHFDLKQGRGGLVDLEFSLQHEVLAAGVARDWPTESAALIPLLADPDDPARGEPRRRQHAELLRLSLHCTLQGRRRVIDRALLPAGLAAPAEAGEG